MNGRTHTMVGLASAIALAPGGTRTMILGSVVVYFSSTLPDADLIDNSKGKGLRMIAECIKRSMIPITFVAYYNGGLEKVSAWIALLIAMVLMPHRGFTHSIWCLMACTGMWYWTASGHLWKWFAVGYASHLLIDLLNQKDELILFPKGFCFNFCSSDGLINDLLGEAAAVVFVVLLIQRIGGRQIDLNSLKTSYNALQGFLEAHITI